MEGKESRKESGMHDKAALRLLALSLGLSSDGPCGTKLANLGIKYSSLPAIQAEALKRNIPFKVVRYNREHSSFTMDIPKISSRRWKKFHLWLAIKGHIAWAGYD